MTYSMTGFATGRGEGLGHGWSWELRSVNAKGLDLRLRVPDWVPGLEASLRGVLTKGLARGSVTLNLRLSREDSSGRLAVNSGQLDAVLDALREIEARAGEQGVALRPASGVEVLQMRGVLEQAAPEENGEALRQALLADFDAVLEDFLRMRAGEGRAVAQVLAGQLDAIEALVVRATSAAAERLPRQQEALQTAMARVLEGAGGQDPDRIAQELALLAIKADVTEELDRLGAHVTAARALLAEEGPVGRKLDFLSQEFNREANTLCSKAQDKALTAIGLEMKTLIDQMREQVQNIE
ncbi:YicC/YloC family endoribonuclease [Oceanicola sp. S124]|uniref:YicC/YloC family endoribonuclease n=1 Tax=Oceanicola sp. S124 TaxID=1042378 RepID=UPI0002557DD9|nr:YicC/YloC family endoribonuclease [Oceanicola sp. S124]